MSALVARIFAHLLNERRLLAFEFGALLIDRHDAVAGADLAEIGTSKRVALHVFAGHTRV